MDEDERDRLAKNIADALPPSMKADLEGLRRLERIGGRIYEATRWAFWINDEEVCGYPSRIPLKDVINEIRQGKLPNPIAHSREMREMRDGKS